MNAVLDAIDHWSHVAPLLRAPTSEAEYDELVSRLDDVLARGGHDEAHPLALLAARMGDLIEAYDEECHPLPEVRGAEALRFLMQEHGLRQGDMPEVGTQSIVSDILSGRRRLNARQIRELARRFSLPADVFMDRDDIVPVSGPKTKVRVPKIPLPTVTGKGRLRHRFGPHVRPKSLKSA